MWTGSRGWALVNRLSQTGSRGQALVDAPLRLTTNSTCSCCSRSLPCDPPATHPRPTRRGSRGGALAEGLLRRALAEVSRARALADKLSRRGSHRQALADRLSRMRPPPTTHPRPTREPPGREGLLRRALAEFSYARALADELSRTGSHGQALVDRLSRTGSRRRALATHQQPNLLLLFLLPCDPPVTHPRPTSDPPRGALVKGLSQRDSQMGLSRTGSRERARKKTAALPTARLPHPLTLIGKCRVIGIYLF